MNRHRLIEAAPGRDRITQLEKPEKPRKLRRPRKLRKRKETEEGRKEDKAGKRRKPETPVNPRIPFIISTAPPPPEDEPSLLTRPMINCLKILYSDPKRHYHNIKHVEDLLTLLDVKREFFHDRPAVEAAIWFHDAVYDTHATPHENKQKCAELADEMFTDEGVHPARILRIKQMIEATATHKLSAHVGSIARYDPRRERRWELRREPDVTLPVYYRVLEELGPEEKCAKDLACFLDLDLSILGRREGQYTEYEENLRKEYEWMDDESYHVKRLGELRSIIGTSDLDGMGKDPIFHTIHFRECFERRAKENIGRTLRDLETWDSKSLSSSIYGSTNVADD